MKDKTIDSQIFNKVVNYTENLKKDSMFLSELKWFRKHYVSFDTHKSIPERGLRLPKTKKKHSENLDEYHYMHSKESTNKLAFDKKKELFSEKYGLDILQESLTFLIYYNSIKPMKDIGVYINFAHVYNLNYLIENHKVFDESDRMLGLFFRSEIAPVTPILICINSYMSQRDIIDFIKKTYNTRIKPIGELYRNKNLDIKDVRTVSGIKKTRNDFIYKNRKLPIMQLTKIVSQKFGKPLDYTYIRKIIKEQEKRK